MVKIFDHRYNKIMTKQVLMSSSDTQEDNKPVNTPFARQYRSSLGITWDILQACIDAGVKGIPVFRISQKANISHGVVVENCQRLTDAGMIETNKINRKYIFRITEKGIKFFHELQKFQDLAREINIRY